MNDEERKLKKLADALEAANEDHVTPEDVGAIVKTIYQAFEKKAVELFNSLSAKVDQINGNRDADFAKVHGKIDHAHDLIQSLDENLHNALEVLELVPGEPGAPGEKGKDAEPVDEEALIERLLARLELTPGEKGLDGSPDTPEQVYEKLLTILEEEGLPAKYIKDLPKLANRPFFGGATALHALSDVDVSGIVVGQSVKWDGVRWIPYTPAAGSNTVVLDETPLGSGTSFTLAHTPAANTLRLYRGGARITVVNGDYTIATATITLTSTLQSAETLTADYEY